MLTGGPISGVPVPSSGALMVAQTVVAIAETFIFGRLGTEALAGFALVFPFMMMMTMMAAGGMGGGVAAAMARAVGGGRIDDARALVLHALTLGLGLALLFTLLAWTAAPALYRVLGGEVPSPLKPPSGCVFHTRCPLASEECRREVPQLREIKPGQFAACIKL